MSEERKKSGPAFWITITLLLVLVAYPLSIGPLMWLSQHGLVPGWLGPLMAAYVAPAGLVASLFPPFDAFMTWYVRLWI
jgi:hypothetical protein